MDINNILNELRAEKEEIERAIIALEGIGRKRRGRPPQWMKAVMRQPTRKHKNKRTKEQGK